MGLLEKKEKQLEEAINKRDEFKDRYISSLERQLSDKESLV